MKPQEIKYKFLRTGLKSENGDVKWSLVGNSK